MVELSWLVTLTDWAATVAVSFFLGLCVGILIGVLWSNDE